MSSEPAIFGPGVREPEIVGLSVAAVARRLGVAPGTLRTWDRRYGLGPSERTAGTHRRYSTDDLARLLYMHKLVISGLPPAAAAQLAITYKGDIQSPELLSPPVVEGQLVNALFRATEALDRVSIEHMIRSQIDKDGIVGAWNNLLVPMLAMIGEEWQRSGAGIASEHMVSEIIKQILGERAVVANPRNERVALLACIGEELHSLAIMALAAALAEENIAVEFLGPRTPIEAISEVVRRTAPPAIFLWAQMPDNATFDKIIALPSVRPAPRIILGGPGWAGMECRGAIVATDLVGARREIANALGL